MHCVDFETHSWLVFWWFDTNWVSWVEGPSIAELLQSDCHLQHFLIDDLWRRGYPWTGGSVWTNRLWGTSRRASFIHVSCLFCLSFCPHFPQWWISSPCCFWSWCLWQVKYLLCMHKALSLKSQTSPKGLWVWWSVYNHISKNQWPAWVPESMLVSQTSQTNKF